MTYLSILLTVLGLGICGWAIAAIWQACTRTPTAVVSTAKGTVYAWDVLIWVKGRKNPYSITYDGADITDTQKNMDFAKKQVTRIRKEIEEEKNTIEISDFIFATKQIQVVRACQGTRREIP